jgi:Zn-dependent protease
VTGNAIYLVTIWALPVIIAITFHEAAHGFAAHLLGDDTAWWLGRVSLNPLRHVDPFGTVLLPGMLLLLHAPFLFGYAKPVPVDFGALRRPRRDMVLVAAAGPAMNFALAVLAALAFHVTGYFPWPASQFLMDNLQNALIVNIVLALFNLFPIPPLDGGRILVGTPPQAGDASRQTRAIWSDHSGRAVHRYAAAWYAVGAQPQRSFARARLFCRQHNQRDTSHDRQRVGPIDPAIGGHGWPIRTPSAGT